MMKSRARAFHAVAATVAVAALGAGTLATASTAAATWRRPPLTYSLSGDAGGSKFEGIGADQRSGAFYVSEVTGGEIHRGYVDRPAATEWLSGEGYDGRWTARGIDVDNQGRVYIAGGPNSTDHSGAPDLWVYSAEGTLLAALRTGASNVMINDVAVGRDGAAYFTDSNTPRIFRVVESPDGWTVTLWRDASEIIPAPAGFNLNGIVATPDGKALLAVQSTLGKLWRFDLQTTQVTEVDVRDADLTSGDGLVLKGRELTVVRNFPRLLTTVKLSGDWSRARLDEEAATPADRLLTTAKIVRGRLLAVDSKFDENPALPPYEVIALPKP
jgi:hypothetical protein